MNIEIEDSQTDGPVTEGFKDFLQKAVTRSFEVRQPNPEALRISQIILEGNLDELNPQDLRKVFEDAGMFFEGVIVKCQK